MDPINVGIIKFIIHKINVADKASVTFSVNSGILLKIRVITKNRNGISMIALGEIREIGITDMIINILLIIAIACR
jgi:hypothetical protein